MMRRLVLICVCLMCTGCWDSVELENRGFVNAIGIDKYDGDLDKYEEAITGFSSGSAPRYVVSCMLPGAETMSGEGNGGDTLKLAAGETLSDTLQLINLSSSKRVYLGHVKAVVFGEGIMRDEALMRETLEVLEHNRELGRKVYIAAAKGSAYPLISAAYEGEPMFGTYLSRVYKNKDEISGAAFALNLDTLLNEIIAEGDAVIPLADITNKQIKLGGAAIINNYSLAGALDDDQTRGLLWVRGKCGGARVSADTDMTMSVSRAKGRLTFTEEDGHLVCAAHVDVDGTLEGRGVGANKNSYEKIITKEIETAFEKLQTLGVDGFGAKETLRKHYPYLYNAYVNDWEEAYRAMRIKPVLRVSLTA